MTTPLDEPSAHHLRDITNRLKALVPLPRSDASRTMLLEHLHSKWTGVQTVAAEGLLRYASDEPGVKDELKSWVLSCRKVEHAYGLWNTSMRLLAFVIDPEDAPWLFENFLSLMDQKNDVGAWCLFHALPPEVLWANLEREKTHENYLRRRLTLNLAACFRRIGDAPRRAFLTSMLSDPDTEIRRVAKSFLNNPAWWSASYPPTSSE